MHTSVTGDCFWMNLGWPAPSPLFSCVVQAFDHQQVLLTQHSKYPTTSQPPTSIHSMIIILLYFIFLSSNSLILNTVLRLFKQRSHHVLPRSEPSSTSPFCSEIFLRWPLTFLWCDCCHEAPQLTGQAQSKDELLPPGSHASAPSYQPCKFHILARPFPDLLFNAEIPCHFRCPFSALFSPKYY